MVMEVRFDLLTPHPLTLNVCYPAQPRPSGVHTDTNIGIAQQPSNSVASKILVDPIPLIAGVVDKGVVGDAVWTASRPRHPHMMTFGAAGAGGEAR